MSPAFTTRRRAEDFDRLVEAARHGRPTSGPVPTELAELAALATSLREVADVAPRPAFSADLRERLMAAAATELLPATEVNDRLTVRGTPDARRRHERRLTVGIASLAIIGASAGTALASQGALPGQPLYPVKRAIENVRSGFTPSESGKGAALLSDADTRLDEVAQLSRGSDDHTAEITATLNAFADQAKKASDLLLSNYQESEDTASIEKLHAFTADSIDQLTVLEPLLPADAKDALTTAAQAVLMIDTAARNLCPTCGGNPITALPETLLSATANTIGTIATSLQPRTGGSTGAGAGTGTAKTGTSSVKLPTVPSNVGPANVVPTSLPSAGPVIKGVGGSLSGGATSTPKPTAKPSTLGEVAGQVGTGLNDTVNGVVGTITGTVNGVVGGLLGSTKTTAP